ncbi:Alg9-like mannosyltransferase family-domain-containing protein [Microdochium trichocladiopsis]|uniref:Mannosyltransferase n=1 Tax=Microdochium trichocladiopsis TaxID=1682393 RepID=A0A9P8YG14_9PEZI|nr:Alg9-like mannosyltransferase family-domain-containing protein [Microdochium trichocladiopsis]KAH7041042.1 Alg9-like mannosyltransferase family-domain-containing protein [Microdochium trichocladiopsis]
MAPSRASKSRTKDNAVVAAPAEASAAAEAGAKAEEVAKLVAQQARETLYVMFAWRCINAFACRTFFQPDEYYQALEPAWQMVFGPDSGAWLTWEWTYGLRSSLHPAIFAIGYALVDNSIGDLYSVKAKWLVAVPRVMQAGFAALGDWYSWRLAERLFGHSTSISWAVLAMTMLNPWHFYTATRTFSNCLEATLTIAALFYWPWELLGVEKTAEGASKDADAAPLATSKQVSSLRLSFFLAALAILLRPTNALIWFAVGTLMLTRATLDGESPLTQRNLLVIFREAIVGGAVAIWLALLADRAYFGEWTFTAVNLVRFNVAQDLASFYGQNDWHYYLSQGIPLTCTTLAPFVLTGLWKSTSFGTGESDVAMPLKTRNALKTLSFAALTNIASLSLISHKEVRFITPLMPIFHVIAAPYVTFFFTNAKAAAAMCPPPRLQWRRTPILALGVIANIVIAVYLSWFHAAGPNLVMSYLRNEFDEIHPESLAIDMDRRLPNVAALETKDTGAKQDADNELFALFLTPCHATPWRSHLVHPKLAARGLTCDPPVHTQPGSPERAAYQDETSRFFADPAAWLDTELWPVVVPGASDTTNTAAAKAPMARYIVVYDGLEEMLVRYFEQNWQRLNVTGIQKVWTAWNGLFTDDDRKAGNLNVWRVSGVYEETDRARKEARERGFEEKRRARTALHAKNEADKANKAREEAAAGEAEGGK